MITPFFIGFSIVTFLFVMEFLLDYLELILEKGVPVGMVARLFLLGLGWMVALSIPSGVLVGTLMTFGRMSQDNEILAVRSSGVPLATLFKPTFAWGAFWTIFMLVFNNWVLPWTNHEFAQLLIDINRKKPTAELSEGVFIDAFDGHRIVFDELNSRTGEIRGVRILDFTRGQRLQTTTAQTGRLFYDETENLLVLELADGQIFGIPDDAANPGTFRRTDFKSNRLAIGGATENMGPRKRKRGQREMSAGQLKDEIRSVEDKKRDLVETQDEQLQEVGYAGLQELAAFTSPPLPWYARLGRVLGGDGSGPPSSERRFTGPPDVRTLEDFKMTKLQLESLDKRSNQLQVEYHKKFSIAFACMVFVLLGAPLGILARRGGVRAGFLSVAFFLFYYLCLVGGEQLADRRLLNPWLSMWVANIVLGGLGLYFVTRVSGRRLRSVT